MPRRRRDLTRRTLRAASAAALLLIAACNLELEVEFAGPPDFNPRMRIDGEGLDPALGQDTFDPTRGPYRNGTPASEVVSELFPDLGGAEEKLLASNCFWISNPASGAGDFMKASWEAVASLHRQSWHLECTSPTRVGLCRFRDPVSGRSIEVHDLEEEAPICAGDPEPIDYPVLGGFAFEFDMPEGSFTWDEVEIASDLVPIFVFDALEVARAAPDPHRTCPGDVSAFTPFAGGETVAAFFDGPRRCTPSSDTGHLRACAQRCTSRPAGAGAVTYRLRSEFADLERDLSPNVMSVAGTSTLTRRMSWSGSGYVWQTGVDPSGGGRWHENFSPLIRVEQARVYVLEQGVERELPLAPGSGLQLAAAMPGQPIEARTCDGQGSGSGHVFPIFTSGACSADGAPNGPLLATPTYLHEHLDSSASPLLVPLSWSVTTQNPATGDVFLELTVTGRRKDGMALSVSAPHDFGIVPLFEERQQTVVVENIGGEVAVIDGVFLDGSEASDFAFRLPTAPKDLPLSIVGQVSGESLTIAAQDQGHPPLVDGRSDATGTSFSMKRIEYEGTIQELNGYAVEFESGLAFYEDAQATFRAEELAPGSFGVAMQIFAERQPPFELWPGESFEAEVTASPADYGPRLGELHVSAYQLTDPGVAVELATPLIVDGVTEPYLELVPEALYFPTGSAENRGWTRTLLATNPTLFDVERSFQLGGPDAALFDLLSTNDPSLVLEPGGAELFRLRYQPPCPGPVPPAPHQAEIRIETQAGVEIVPLTGFVPLECVEQ